MRSECVRRPIERYSPPYFRSTFVLSTINDKPRTIKEEVNSEEGKLWKKAMVEEMEALDKNQSSDLIEFPDIRKHVGSKWVFKEKLNAVGKIEKYKARLVVKGYSRVEGIDFDDIFSPVEKLTFIYFYCVLLQYLILRQGKWM